MNMKHEYHERITESQNDKQRNARCILDNAWPTSPTFRKEILLKHIDLQDQPHIFDGPDGNNPISVAPATCRDQTSLTDLTGPSQSYQSWTRRHHNKQQPSFGSIGLPSGYPLRTAKAETTFPPILLERSVNFDDTRTTTTSVQKHSKTARRHFKSKSNDSYLSEVGGFSVSSSVPTHQHQQRRIPLPGPAGRHQVMTAALKRRRNYVLCEKDFEEQIFGDLFSDISAHAFAY